MTFVRRNHSNDWSDLLHSVNERISRPDVLQRHGIGGGESIFRSIHVHIHKQVIYLSKLVITTLYLSMVIGGFYVAVCLATPICWIQGVDSIDSKGIYITVFFLFTTTNVSVVQAAAENMKQEMIIVCRRVPMYGRTTLNNGVSSLFCSSFFSIYFVFSCVFSRGLLWWCSMALFFRCCCGCCFLFIVYKVVCL